MPPVTEIRLSSGSTSTCCRSTRSFGETSIVDTYGRDWVCLSARTGLSRASDTSCCTQELSGLGTDILQHPHERRLTHVLAAPRDSDASQASDLTLFLKERYYMEARRSNSMRSIMSDESTEPPADTGRAQSVQSRSVGDSTPVNCGTPVGGNFPPDPFGVYDTARSGSMSRQASFISLGAAEHVCASNPPAAAEGLENPHMPSNVRRAICTLAECSNPSAFSYLRPRTDDLGHPLVLHAKPVIATVEPSPQRGSSTTCAIADKEPLRFRSYDSVRIFDPDNSRCERTPPCKRASTAYKAPPCTPLVPRLQFEDNVSKATRSPAGDNPSSLEQQCRSHSVPQRVCLQHEEVPAYTRKLWRQSSGVPVVQCQRQSSVGSDLGSFRRCFSATTHAEVSTQTDGMHDVAMKPSKQDAALKPGSSRLISSTLHPPASPERRLRSDDLEIQRDDEGVKVAFKENARAGSVRGVPRDLRARERSSSSTAGTGNSEGNSTNAASCLRSPQLFPTMSREERENSKSARVDSKDDRSRFSSLDRACSRAPVADVCSSACRTQSWAPPVATQAMHVDNCIATQSWAPPIVTQEKPLDIRSSVGRTRSWAPPAAAQGTPSDARSSCGHMQSSQSWAPPPAVQEPRSATVRSCSWIPPPCHQRDDTRSCLAAHRSSSQVAHASQATVSNDIVRPLHPSRVSTQLVRPLPSSRVSSNGRAPVPPQRPVRGADSVPQGLRSGWVSECSTDYASKHRTRSPPRRKVSCHASVPEASMQDSKTHHRGPAASAPSSTCAELASMSAGFWDATVGAITRAAKCSDASALSDTSPRPGQTFV
jgi:hypothetical protein